MGKILKIVIGVIVLFAGLSFLSGGTVDVHIGSQKTWTTSNFTTTASSVEDHLGDKVVLDVLVFNHLNTSKTTGLEAYIGTADQLVSNPMDPLHRIYVAYDPQKTPAIQDGSCARITGTLSGITHITTLDGSSINVPYVKSSVVTPVSCK